MGQEQLTKDQLNGAQVDNLLRLARFLKMSVNDQYPQRELVREIFLKLLKGKR